MFWMVIDLFPGGNDGNYVDNDNSNNCFCEAKNDEDHDRQKSACEADAVDPVELYLFLMHKSIGTIDAPEKDRPDLSHECAQIFLRIQSVGIDASDEYPEQPRIGMHRDVFSPDAYQKRPCENRIGDHSEDGKIIGFFHYIL